MKIRVKDIPPRGLCLVQSFSSRDLGLADPDIGCASPIAVDASVSLVGDTVLAHVHVTASFDCSCSRCLKEFSVVRDERYSFDYSIDGHTETVDIGEDIRQEMILGLSRRTLCREDCRGICPGCGADLNNETCSCAESRKVTETQAHKSVG